MEIKLIIMGIACIFAIVLGMKLAKQVVKLVIIVAMVATVYAGYNMYNHNMEVSDISKMANKTVATGKQAIDTGKNVVRKTNAFIDSANEFMENSAK